MDLEILHIDPDKIMFDTIAVPNYMVIFVDVIITLLRKCLAFISRYCNLPVAHAN